MSASTRWTAHSIYGLTLVSDFPFASQLKAGTGPSDLTFVCGDEAPFEAWETDEAIYASAPYPDKNGESEVLMYRADGCLIVRFSGIADFYLWPDRIQCHRRVAEYRSRLAGRYPEHEIEKYQYRMIEIYLLGFVFASWLEWQGIPALHASAVEVNGHAAAFISTGGGGKSSMAVALMRAGHPLLTDDILPVEYASEEFLGRPGYPQMRMWPDQADHFLGHHEDLDLVHPALSKRRVPVEESGLGSFCLAPRPLACLYLPERRDPETWGTKVEIEPVSRREAALTLMGHSFVPAIVQALGLSPRRLAVFSRMAAHVPARRVVYPSGYEYLDRVRQAILQDIAGLVPVSRGA